MGKRPVDPMPALDADRLKEIEGLLVSESSISFRSYRAHESIWMLLDYAKATLGDTECTGWAASWCPVHGSCVSCTRRDDGEWDEHYSACPLHSATSNHAMAALT